MSDINWAIIGDVHSQSHKLEQALDYCRTNNLRPILLGDLFDSRCSFSNSIAVYEMAQSAQKEMGAIILQSNHQNKLIRHLQGEVVGENYGFSQTLTDFGLRDENPKVNPQELLNWLLDLPYAIVFKDSEGNQYRAAHAYFPDRMSEIIEKLYSVESEDFIEFREDDFYNTQLFSIEFTNKYPPVKSFRKLREKMIYGPTIYSQDELKPRIVWWNKKPRRSWTMVAGHYHTVHIDLNNKALVLDAGCGKEGGKLALYELNQKKLITI